MVCVWVLSACGGGGGGGFTALPGGVQTGEDGHAYFVDPNQSGQAESLHLIDVFWGRLVDVFDVDEEGNPRPRPVFRNFVVNENVPSNGLEYTLETNPINQAQRLIIHRSYDPEDPEQNGPGSFLDLLRGASSSLGVVLAKNDDGSSSPPFSFVARNACLVLRFSDLLDDSEDTQTLLPELVRFGTGYPPEAPFEGRVLFDPNHGGAVGARFSRYVTTSSRTVPSCIRARCSITGAMTSFPVARIVLIRKALLRSPLRTRPRATRSMRRLPITSSTESRGFSMPPFVPGR